MPEQIISRHQRNPLVWHHYPLIEQQGEGGDGNSIAPMAVVKRLPAYLDSPLWGDKEVDCHIVTGTATDLFTPYISERRFSTSLVTTLPYQAGIIAKLDYIPFETPEDSEKTLVDLITDSFRKFKEVELIYYTPHEDGLKFAVFLSPEEYDDSLISKLLDEEKTIRKTLINKQILPFDIDYMFNAQLFNFQSVSEESHEVYER